MREILYETIHKADYEYPYLEIGYHSGGFPLHLHEEIEILYMLEGEIGVAIDEDYFTLRNDDICVIPTNHPHTLFPTVNNNICIIKMCPAVELYDIQLEKCIFSPGDAFYSALHKELTTILEEDATKAPGYVLAVRTACDVLTLLIMRELPKQKTFDCDILAYKKKSNLICTVNIFLENNFQTKISLEAVAEAHHYTKCYFSRLFKKITGMNFNTYCTAFRLRKSAILLKTTDISISRIAEECGFASVRSYNRAFKNHYNCTPSKYRA